MMGLTLISGGIVSPDSNIFKDLGSDDFSIREAAMIRLKRIYAEFIKVEEEANNTEDANGKIKGGDSEKGKLNALAAKTAVIVQQTKAYKILRNANIDNTTATELSNDAEIAALVIANGKGKKLKQLTEDVKAYTKALKGSTAAAKANR